MELKKAVQFLTYLWCMIVFMICIIAYFLDKKLLLLVVPFAALFSIFWAYSEFRKLNEDD